MPLLQAHNIHYHYAPKTPVLSDVSVTLHRGKITALVGQSGCGKTTLLHVLAGYLKPTQGSLKIKGQKANDAPSCDRAVMFQQDYLYPWLSVRDNMALGLVFLGENTTAQTNAKVDALLNIVNLRDFAHKKPHQLSGGQRQRVAFARCLATDPSLILLDEPFAALDPYTRERLQNRMRQTVLNRKIGLILVSHSVAEVVYMADEVLILKNGTIAQHLTIPLSQEDRQNPEKRIPLENQLSAVFKH